ncbi:MAG: bifunctional pyr operon transcriptional regulator/uracil phosphoribosyltransferase PyrR [Cytophagales bacterium]|nr:bifunctional pyr operon transcriptional regulator/uracil phosphoribosyltransferase PyrR [Cytophagales bacterium]
MRRLLLNDVQLALTFDRLCLELLSGSGTLSNTLILGLQPRGYRIMNRIRSRISSFSQESFMGYGSLDLTFHRDDLRHRKSPLPTPLKTDLPFDIERKSVILVDDVLFTGRSARAALEALWTYGRPYKVELLVLIDRLYSRHVPIEADYVGRSVNVLDHERVQVGQHEKDEEIKEVWLRTCGTHEGGTSSVE